MKRLLLIVVLLLLASLGRAVPRVGSHDGYTRLVFDLPALTTASGTLLGQTYTVKLGRALPSASGALSAPGLSRYQVSGQRLTLTLSGAGTPRLQVLPASGAQAARLVVDVPLKAASKKAAPKRVAAPRPPPARAPARPQRLGLTAHGGD